MHIIIHLVNAGNSGPLVIIRDNYLSLCDYCSMVIVYKQLVVLCSTKHIKSYLQKKSPETNSIE